MDETTRILADDLRLLVAATEDYAIFMLDPDGNILTWNAGAQRIKGYSPDEAIGRHFSIFYPQEALAVDHPAGELQIARATGKFTEEGWRLRKDGSRFWASVTITALWDDNGELRGFGKVTRDLTDRRLAEEQLRLAEEQLRLAFDEAPTGMALVALDGSWLRVNDVLCEIVGRSRETLLAGRVSDLFEEEPHVEGAAAAPAYAGDDSEAVLTRLLGTDPAADAPLVRPDGRMVWVHLSARLITSTSGGPARLVLQMSDVSARVAAHDTLQEAERAKSRFVAMTSHELRSPLTSIVGFAGILERRWDRLSEADRRKHIATISVQARRLQFLVEDLLTLSSIESGELALHRRTVDLVSLVWECIDATDLDVAVEAPDTLPADVDPLRVSQVVTNLLNNARKYGRPPYAVEVGVSEGWIRIAVTDHGAGVEPDFVPVMFERFTQADTGLRRSSQGTGLGLAISRTLARAHGGDLQYESAPEGGACLVLLLPDTGYSPGV